MDVGFQLYSARNYQLDDVLSSIAKLGYKHVEGNVAVEDLPSFKTKLAANGLTMPTAHASLADVEDASKTLKTAEALGIKVVICPWLPPELRPLDVDGWKRLAERLEKAAAPYVSAGLSLGYHNHDFEFATYNGRYAMDLLLEGAPSLSVEPDVAWIVRGKADPVEWTRKFGDRIVAVHLKDVTRVGENGGGGDWADVGDGVVPWQSLWPVLRQQTTARYFVVEHDSPTDVHRTAARSLAFIQKLGA
jgi:sugar phosphate isomerase/epimerase